jgi:hypothetical protein
MLYLLEFLDMVPTRIVGGDKYAWLYYGDNARYLDMEQNVEIVFNEKTEEIYEIAIREGYDIECNTIWRSPDYEPVYLEEVKERHNLDKEELELRKSNIVNWHEIIDKVNQLYDSGPIFK